MSEGSSLGASVLTVAASVCGVDAMWSSRSPAGLSWCETRRLSHGNIEVHFRCTSGGAERGLWLESASTMDRQQVMVREVGDISTRLVHQLCTCTYTRMVINGGTGKNNFPGGIDSFLNGKRGSRLKCSCRILRGICNCTNTVYQLFFSNRPQIPLLRTMT